MTIREVLSAMVHRWYIPLALLACAALVTMLLIRDGGVYTTHTVVSFRNPGASSLSPDNGTQDASVIAFAGTVVQEANGGTAPARYSTSDAPLYGAGIREGALVNLADSGSQWVATYNKSDIQIQVVGRTFDWVEMRQKELVGRILSVASSEQASLDIAPKERITASLVPLTTQIDYVAPSRGSQASAAAALLAVALVLGAWGSITVDRLRARRRNATVSHRQVSSHRSEKGTPPCISPTRFADSGAAGT